MRIAYLFNEKKQFDGALILKEEITDPETGTILVEAGPYPENSTDIEPGSGLQNPAKFDGTNWIPATDEEHAEWLKNNPSEDGYEDNPNSPSETDQAIASIILTQAQNKVEQDQINASNLLDIATIKSRLNGGTN